MSSIPYPPSPERDQPPPPQPRPSEVPVVESDQLFDGRTEIRVLHRGEEYRLRITRQGKLILTK
jgi:hemin uptake protein HemP